MGRKKATPQESETPILAYTSISERTMQLSESVMKVFADYSEYFQEKAGYELNPADVVAAKGNELFTNPDKIQVPRVEEKKDERLSLPNSAWAGIDNAARHHQSTPEMIVETLAKNLLHDESFLRWVRKKERDARKKTAH